MEDLLIKSNFITDTNYIRLFGGIVILFLLTKLIEYNYKKNIHSNDNKNIFSKNMFPFVLSMFLIVTVIKSSLALSLGLVGALSIIRFRTAIKEPEQIINLLALMAVAIGIAAEKEILAIIVTLIYFLSSTTNSIKKHDKQNNAKRLTISFNSKKDISINTLTIKPVIRLYKNAQNDYSVDYNIYCNDDVEQVLNELKKIVNSKIEYEIQ